MWCWSLDLRWPDLTRCRLVLVAVSVLVCWFAPIISAAAATSIILEVGAAGAPPGFQKGNNLPRYLALHMNDAGLTEWRFEPATGEGLPANYVLWAFRLNPYAGGEVRSFRLQHMRTGTFRRPITLEARLYLNGEYQTLVEGQALIEGSPDDPGLASAVTKLTRSLLGASGAYRRIDTGQRRADPSR
jgi:hypothetical protein